MIKAVSLEMGDKIKIAIEVFKPAPRFPNYEVSNFGRVRTLSRLVRYTHSVTNAEHFRKTQLKYLKVQYNKRTGYKFYCLYINKKCFNINVHSLVADAFLEKDDGLDFVNHEDGNKHNNFVGNLKRCTNEYNHEHATVTGLKAKGSEIGTSKLNEHSVHAIKWFLKKGFPHSEISRAFRISRPTISLIKEGKIWGHVSLIGEEINYTP